MVDFQPTHDKLRWRRQRCTGLVLVLTALIVALIAGNLFAQRLPRERYKNGSAVRKAFRPVVAAARRSTVRILADGKQVALGAGVDADGGVITKASDLKGRLTCRLQEGHALNARIVGVHQEFDLAMLKIEADGLPAVTWRLLPAPAVGEWLATPGLDELPVAVGVVSVKPRSIPPQRGILGISISEATPGPRITRVFPNSGAAKAGLKVDDVITRVAGNVVRKGAVLSSTLRKFRPGDTLSMRIVRGEKRIDVRARLGRPLSSFFDRSTFQNRIGGALSRRRTGFPTVLQHDTILQPQECGGVIVDLDGKAVGLNIARAGRTETYAIPAAQIVLLLAELKSGKLAPLPANRNRPSPPPLPEGP